MTANPDIFFPSQIKGQHSPVNRAAQTPRWPVHSSGRASVAPAEQASSGADRQAKADTMAARYRGLHLLGDTRQNGPRGPHPGDIVYWITCLGAACLLLLAAT